MVVGLSGWTTSLCFPKFFECCVEDIISITTLPSLSQEISKIGINELRNIDKLLIFMHNFFFFFFILCTEIGKEMMRTHRGYLTR